MFGILRKKPSRARIALLGSRGIPAKYGGFETIAQELGIGLTKKGFDVYVACESRSFRINPHATYDSVKLVHFPIINSIRTISEVFYDTLSTIWASLNVDTIYMLGYSSIIALLFPKLLRKTVIVNVDGLEWKRRKFSKVIRLMLRVFEVFTVRIADFVVADSEVVAAYYRRNYGTDPTYIPNGLREVSPYSAAVLETLGLNKYGYYLAVARLEPENNVDLIIKGFKLANSGKKLAIIGNVKNTSYCRELVKLKDERVVFLGGIYDRQLLMTIRRFSYAYIHGHEVGGTNPSLVEALSCSNAVLALNTPFNIEVLGDAGLYFGKDPADLKKQVENLEANDIMIDSMRSRAYERYVKGYTVERMTMAFLCLLKMANSIRFIT